VVQPFESLGRCGEFYTDVNTADASEVWAIKGGKYGGKAWFKVTCDADNDNWNSLLVYSRKDVKGFAPTKGLKCDRFKAVGCDKKKKKEGIDIVIEPGLEYLFVVVSEGLGDKVDLNYRCNSAPSKAPTPIPGKRPTGKPTVKQVTPDQLRCDSKILTNTKKLGKIQKPYSTLGKCGNEVVADIDGSDASEIWSVRGGKVGGKAWFKIVCKTNKRNWNSLVVYSRPIKRGLGLVENFKCERFDEIQCNGSGTKREGIDMKIDAGKEYIFIVASDGLGDDVSLTYNCNKSSAPTKSPTVKPTKNPRPVQTIPNILRCDKAISINTKKFGTVDRTYDGLNSCGKSALDLRNKADGSEMWTVKGGKLGGKAWFKAVCKTTKKNKNRLAIYSRKAPKGGAVVADPVASFKCVDEKVIDCTKLGTKGGFDLTIKAGLEYIFIASSDGLGDQISMRYKCNELDDISPTTKPTKATKKPTRIPLPPGHVKCGQRVLTNTKKLGVVQRVYDDLPVCDFAVDLRRADASEIWTVNGRKFGGKAWFKIVCKTAKKNWNTVFVYSRKAKRGLGPVDNFQCGRVVPVECDKKNLKRGIDMEIEAGREYLFLVASEGVGDDVTLSYQCNSS